MSYSLFRCQVKTEKKDWTTPITNHPHICDIGFSRKNNYSGILGKAPWGWGFFPLVFSAKEKKKPHPLGLFASLHPNIFLLTPGTLKTPSSENKR